MTRQLWTGGHETSGSPFCRNVCAPTCWGFFLVIKFFWKENYRTSTGPSGFHPLVLFSYKCVAELLFFSTLRQLVTFEGGNLSAFVYIFLCLVCECQVIVLILYECLCVWESQSNVRLKRKKQLKTCGWRTDALRMKEGLLMSVSRLKSLTVVLCWVLSALCGL